MQGSLPRVPGRVLEIPHLWQPRASCCQRGGSFKNPLPQCLPLFVCFPGVWFSSATNEAPTKCLAATLWLTTSAEFLYRLRKFSDVSGYQTGALEYWGISQCGAVIKLSHVTTDPNFTRPQNFSSGLPFQKNRHHPHTGAKGWQRPCFIYCLLSSSCCYLEQVVIFMIFIAGFVHLRPCCCFRQLILSWQKSGRCLR